MRRMLVPLMILALAVTGCRKMGTPATGGGTRKASPDAANAGKPLPPEPEATVLARVQESAESIVQNAGNCEAIREALPGVTQQLDEAAKRLQGAEQRSTLDALRSRVTEVAKACH